MTITMSQSKVIVGSETYLRPPQPQPLGDDFYVSRSRHVLADHGRATLEYLIKDRVRRESSRLNSLNSSSWQKSKKKTKSNRVQRYVQRWPWSTKIWTTSSVFVPTHYERNRIPGAHDDRPEYALSGIQIRISEHRYLMWRPAQVPIPPDFNLERDAATKAFNWKRKDMVRPLKGKFERALVEHLPDEILAALWYRLHKTQLQ